MKTLAIYHEPQERGNPYVLLVNLEDGQVVKIINIPYGYYNSGMIYQPRREMLNCYEMKKFTGIGLPKIGEVTTFNRKGEEYILESITDVKEWTIGSGDDIIKGNHATLHYRKFRTVYEFRFCASEDNFRKELENQGIDMAGWCVYKRRKTDFKEFLKSVLSPYDIINLITIN